MVFDEPIWSLFYIMKIQIVVRRSAIVQAEKHAQQDPTLEVGGVLLGKFVLNADTLQVLVVGIVRALKAESTTLAIKFTPTTWTEIWKCIDGHKHYADEKQWQIVGWYHTHPNVGAFFSSHDANFHKVFTSRGHIALVIDPTRSEKAFFCWDDLQEVMNCYPLNNIQETSDEEMYNLIQGTTSSILPSLPDCEIY